MILLSHPTGNTPVRQTIEALEQAHLLAAYYTGIGLAADSAWVRQGYWMPSILRKRIYAIASQHLYTYWRPECIRQFKKAFGHNQQVYIDQLYAAHDAHVAKNLQKHSIQAVYAYEDGACATFQAATKSQIACLYELPIAYWETTNYLLEEEAQRYPEWAQTLLLEDPRSDKYKLKTQEMELATHIFCPSSFVLKSIPDRFLATKQAFVVPYGCFNLPQPAGEPTHQPLRVLFAGSLTQRKGLADLFAAFRYIDPQIATLTVMGSPLMHIDFYYNQYPHFKFEPIRPHADVLELMRQMDVLVLPSIVEGRALVQLEAMACGLPVIATPHTGAQDLIDEGSNGYTVPIRQPEKIAEKIIYLAQNPDVLCAFKQAAWQKSQILSWDKFKQELLQKVMHTLKDPGIKTIDS